MCTILITSGGTRVPIDEVRHVGNMSSGRFGADLAREALKAGHRVIFLCAKGSVRPDEVTLNLGQGKSALRTLYGLMADEELHFGIRNLLTVDQFANFDEYAAKLQQHLEQDKPDITMLAAAVSDYGMPPTGGKISSDEDSITFTMTRLPKLIARVKQWCPSTLLVGFKLLVDSTPESMGEAASRQIRTADCDYVVANDLRSIRAAKHTVYLYRKDNPDPQVFGTGLAQRVIGCVTSTFQNDCGDTPW